MSLPAHNPALVTPIGAPMPAAPARGVGEAAPAVPFANVLGKTDGVRFSGHAAQRLERRGIAVDGPTLQRLDDGVRRAAGKGARDAVVLVDQTAFVVSVSNKTVITAVDKQHMKDHVFTNIDSAVIA
ncbi:flagellar biosynthesis protein [Paraconexibacter antarcticus]|uniref:Flagellar biosynthesis protein n=1 Tax=Paraconexibacter antarcticus TaxID=2949664 RepID=A0ABY5DRL2_9ACTN|nr:TIGR02530 family flagellar biosynthesis protein [Paraconexibacter antarcticus]UTI64668.1 flagellar biosynthesis protein [Paraconexibacter antarcticus]